jgi:septal ring factor EnvC (AmiA/AmiB activator)
MPNKKHSKNKDKKTLTRIELIKIINDLSKSLNANLINFNRFADTTTSSLREIFSWFDRVTRHMDQVDESISKMKTQLKTLEESVSNTKQKLIRLDTFHNSNYKS